MTSTLIGYVRRHHVGLIALIIASSGTAYAATLPRNSVGTAQLKSNAVTSGKVRDGSLQTRDFKTGQLPSGSIGPQERQGPGGPIGSQGAAGPQGPEGEDGLNGLDGLDGSAFAYALVVTNAGPTPFIVEARSFGIAQVARRAEGGEVEYCVKLEPLLAHGLIYRSSPFRRLRAMARDQAPRHSSTPTQVARRIFWAAVSQTSACIHTMPPATPARTSISPSPCSKAGERQGQERQLGADRRAVALSHHPHQRTSQTASTSNSKASSPSPPPRLAAELKRVEAARPQVLVLD